MAKKVLVVYRDHEYPYKPGVGEVFEGIARVRLSFGGWLVLIPEEGAEFGISRDVVFTYLTGEDDVFDAEVAKHAGDE